MEIHDLRTALSLLALTLPLYGAVPDGYVVKVESATVYLDWGKAAGVQKGDSFDVYRAGEPLKHPVTGEVLGQTETLLGKGAIDTVEEKFSMGVLMESKGVIKPGDRTRHTEIVAAAPVAVVPGEAAASSVVLKELWRSDALARQATGLAIGDIDGDGKKEVVVSYRDQIEVFRSNGQKMESIATFKSRGYSNYLAVETGDLDGAGHDKIFASLFLEGVKRSRVLVLEFSQGTLHEVGRMDGFVRAFEHPDGKRELVWQDMSMARELRMKRPAPVSQTSKGFREGNPLKLSRDLNSDQLFGYAWGDWDGDGSEDFAILQNGERLRLFFKDAKWSASDGYGGTNADFSWDNDQVGCLYPRLLSLKSGAGKAQLLVPHNIPFSPIHLTHLKIYKKSEILDLAWNGLEMKPVWTLPISGALADFGVGDVLGRGTPQLWIAAVGAGDKTVLLAYQLP